MKKILNPLIAIFLLPSPVLAHTGHELKDGLHQTIAVIAIFLSVAIIFTGYRYFQKRKVRK